MKMVADAVTYEPVSNRKFPNTRECAATFRNLWGNWFGDASKTRARSSGYSYKSLGNEAGNFLAAIGKIDGPSRQYSAGALAVVFLRLCV
jgi:hypothetical protein